MPQARLPDVNTAIIVYRREAITDLKGERYDSCLGALNALNGMLPDKYRVVISTIEYNKMMKEGMFAVCNYCKTENDYEKVRTLQYVLPYVDKLISGANTEKVWVCQKCNNENKPSLTHFKNKIFKKPFFLRTVPDPPERKEGMVSRTRYHSKFASWFWTTLGEIEAQFAQFRDDNWKKPGELYDYDEDFGETGEDQD